VSGILHSLQGSRLLLITTGVLLAAVGKMLTLPKYAAGHAQGPDPLFTNNASKRFATARNELVVIETGY
jgi:hypothetical protein